MFDRSVLYPIPWADYKRVFSTSPGDGTDIVVSAKMTGYLVHMWNKFGKEYRIEANSNQAYALLASEFCPCMYTTALVFN